ncbi:ATP-binding protein [Enterococcus sp. AZ177]|uniref:ATP-binding protein n=1 Tax=unclassified Enterococcus TaxID=2608891 RepID=UPI003D2FA810
MKQKEYLIDIDPRILELLGPHLYTNIYYILGELIANAYDADASNVYIIEKEDRIIVEDDGTGMSYEDKDIEKYLQVAHESRKSKDDDKTKRNKRRKMGRKGIGKLASLSVSENVNIKTIKNGEKSGFILTQHVEDDRKLVAIDESTITFERIKNNGTSIEMLNPSYSLPKTQQTLKNNLLKIFPLVDETFVIHLVNDGKSDMLLKESQNSLIKDLGALVTFGEEFKKLNKYFKSKHLESNPSLLENREPVVIEVDLYDKKKNIKKMDLKIEGWIGIYKSTKDSKRDKKDFSDNFISLYANKKLGEFNILPLVGKNALNELYVVGQLHVDGFEDTDFPDMALSNRQGYKDDDERYIAVIDYVREKLLPDMVSKRRKFSKLEGKEKDKKRVEKQKAIEDQFKKDMKNFKDETSKNVVDKIKKLSNNSLETRQIEDILNNEIDKQSGNLKLKSKIESQKKKILISHTRDDKAFSDIIYKMLLHNGFQKSEILYTSCDDQISRIPEDMTIYEYLRDFFVDSLSDEKIFVVYVTSETMGKSWGAVAEVGAGWLIEVNHKIFNLNCFEPKKPLNADKEWQNTLKYDGNFYIDNINFDGFCDKIENISIELGRTPKSRKENKEELAKYANEITTDEASKIKAKLS